MGDLVTIAEAERLFPKLSWLFERSPDGKTDSERRCSLNTGFVEDDWLAESNSCDNWVSPTGVMLSELISMTPADKPKCWIGVPIPARLPRNLTGDTNRTEGVCLSWRV